MTTARAGSKAGYCDKHDLEISSCADCSPRESVPLVPSWLARDWGPLFVAAYYGSCAGCGRDIVPGLQIRADGRGGYLCEDCGEAQADW